MPKQPLAVFLAEHVVQRRADGRLLAGGDVRQGDAAVFDFLGMRLGIEGVDLDLEVAADVAVGAEHGRNLPASPAAIPSAVLLFSASRTCMRPRLVDQEHERGLFLVGFGVDQRRPEHAEHEQQDNARSGAVASVSRRLNDTRVLPGPTSTTIASSAAAIAGHEPIALGDGIAEEVFGKPIDHWAALTPAYKTNCLRYTPSKQTRQTQ